MAPVAARPSEVTAACQVVSGVEQVAGADQRQAHLEDANPGPSQ
jgi:hypothetical protein